MKKIQQKLTKLQAREILDSRGNPTLQVSAFVGNKVGVASVPSGASTGSYEAKELRDNDLKRYLGLGVKKACRNVEGIIFKAIKNIDVSDQIKLDKTLLKLDGTEDKSKLGANSILGVSLAVMRLHSILADQELYRTISHVYGFNNKYNLPTPLFNVINGGVHADSGLDIQEFFLIPKKGNFETKLQQASIIYHTLKQNLKSKKYSVGLGDEGGFAPALGSNSKALQFLVNSIKASGYVPGKDVSLGMDAAASEFYDNTSQIYRLNAGKAMYKPASIVRLYEKWYKDYKLEIIEDPCAEDDFVGWKNITDVLGKKSIIVGDDLFVTNPVRIQKGILNGIANAVLIKPNQIGTLSETIASIELAQANNYKVVISHRSGETNDSFISDLAVAVKADYIKAGAPARGERLAKYNRLVEIEREINGA